MNSSNSFLYLHLVASTAFIATAVGVVMLQRKIKEASSRRRERRKKKELGHVNIGGMMRDCTRCNATLLPLLPLLPVTCI
jgi:hypothetical protein